MVAWAVSSIKDSLLGLLMGDSASHDDVAQLEAARKAMIELLLFSAPSIEEARQLELLQRLRYAADLEALWYLRPELVNALALQRGEREAQIRVRALSHHFGSRASVLQRNSLVGG